MRNAFLALAAVFAATSASAEVVEATDSGFTTRDSVVVKGSRYEAWNALIAPAKWWNKGHTWSGDAANLYISPQANGCFCELLPAADDAPEDVRRGSALHMTVVMVDPGKVLRMRGGLGPLQSEPADGVLTVTLSDADGGTRIVWEYVVGGPMRYEVPEISKAVDVVMSQQLRGLARLLGPLETAEATAAEQPAAKAAPATQPVKEAVKEPAKEAAKEAAKEPAKDTSAKTAPVKAGPAAAPAAKPVPKADPQPKPAAKAKVEEVFNDLIGED